MELKETLTSPLTVIAAVGSAIGTLGLIGPIEPLWSLISTTSGLWFPAVSVTAGVILPEVGYQSLGTSILIAGAVVYVMVQLDRLVERAQKWSKNR